MQAEQFAVHADLETRHWWFVARRQILVRLASGVVRPDATSVAIDVGCGTGANIAAFAPAYSCVGIDASPTAIAYARQRFANVEFLCGQAPEDLAAWLPKTRLMLLTDVLEHVEDDFELLSKLLAALPVGAHLLLTVPAEMALWSQHDVSFGHYRRYDKARLELLWQGLPVAPLLVSYFNTRLYPLVRLVRALGRLRGRSFGNAGTDLRMPGRLQNALLTRLFAGEAQTLERAMISGTATPYRRGVSLIAVLKRLEGPLAVRRKPQDLPPDPHQPKAAAAP